MGDTTFLGRWPQSTRKPGVLLTRSVLRALPDRADVMMWHRWAIPVLFSFLVLVSTISPSGSVIPSFSAELSDREEDGLRGAVQSVETTESLLVQTDRYDPRGRLIERIQEAKRPLRGCGRCDLSTPTTRRAGGSRRWCRMRGARS